MGGIRKAGGPDHETLLRIADVIDMVVERRNALYTKAATDAASESAPALDIDNAELRRDLFALLDDPTQALWERVREIELVPSYVPGLPTPSPLGLSLADFVFSLGLSDRQCPSRADLVRALLHVGDAFDLPG
jgi:hypothetical protein